MTAAGHVDEITESEIPEVAGFLARQARAGEAVVANPLPPVDRLRWLLLENPARDPSIPFGWRIRSDGGAIVGAAICSPFCVGAGDVSMTALMFSKFFVDVPFRGMGLGLLMRFVREGKRFPLFCTSTNAVAGQLFQKVGATKIAGMEHTMLGITASRGLAEEWLYRRTNLPGLSRALAIPAAILTGRIDREDLFAAARESEFVAMNDADAVAAMNLPRTIDRVAVIRDRNYIHWRYFTGEADKRIFEFSFPGEGLRLVVANRVQSGYRGQIRVLNVLDVWPPTSARSASALAACLAREYSWEFDTIWLRSQPREAEAALKNAGFRRHDFPAPLGWFIDTENRLRSKSWYLMLGESE